MALTNRITGESLDQEIQHNQQAAQTDAPNVSSELPTSPKTRRKKPSVSEEIPLHTQLYLLEKTEEQIRRLTEATDRAEALLKMTTELQNKTPEASAEEDETSEQPVDELVAEYGLKFDDHCKRIYDQRLSDAQKECDRLCQKLSRTASQADGVRRLLIGTLVNSIAALLMSVATIILLLTR